MTKEEWLVDTSATSNITYVISCISNKIVHTALLTVEVPNGYMVKVQSMGQVSIGKRLILENFL